MPEEVYFSPERSYNLEVTIKGKKDPYTQDLRRVRIGSSIAAIYPTVELEMFISPKDMILDGIFGQDPITLSIQLKNQDGNISETTELELMFLRLAFEVPVTVKLANGQQEDRSVITVTTIVRQPYVTMTTLVNGVWGGKGSQKTVKEIFEELVDQAGATLEYDSEGENTESIDQVCIPPTILFRAFRYLNNTFGTHDGVPVAFCSYENVVRVINLSKRIKKSYAVHVTQLASDLDRDEFEEISQKTTDGRHFYTQDNIQSDHIANSKFGVLGKNLVHIVKPRDTLYSTVEQSLDDVCSDYGLIDGSGEIPIDDNIERTKYYIGHTGYESSEVFANSMVARQIYNLSSVSFEIERNIQIENLLKVGEPVKLKTLTSEYKDLSGKYILFSSDITWRRVKDWETTARLELIRTNKTI